LQYTAANANLQKYTGDVQPKNDSDDDNNLIHNSNVINSKITEAKSKDSIN